MALTDGGRERASAGVFTEPGTYRRSEVNSAMYERCLSCLADHGAKTL